MVWPLNGKVDINLISSPLVTRVWSLPNVLLHLSAGQVKAFWWLCALFLLRWRRGPAPGPLERDDSTDLGPERRVSRPGAGWFAQEEGPRSGLCLGLPGLVQSRAASLGGRADPG